MNIAVDFIRWEAFAPIIPFVSRGQRAMKADDFAGLKERFERTPLSMSPITSSPRKLRFS
jgi:hypothetical protein